MDAINAIDELTLQICTTDGVAFDGTVKDVSLRSVVGDVCIMKNHANYMTAIDYGKVVINTPDGRTLIAACTEGFLSVSDNTARLIATTFEFSDDIDVQRAENAAANAKERIEQKRSPDDLARAEAKLKRALIRLSVAGSNK